jgi:hypothetical protein
MANVDVDEQPVAEERGPGELVPRHRHGRAGDGAGPDVGGEVVELAVAVHAPQERLPGPVGVLAQQDADLGADRDVVGLEQHVAGRRLVDQLDVLLAPAAVPRPHLAGRRPAS